MKKLTFLILFLLSSFLVFSQKKEEKKTPKQPEKKSLPKRVYKSWMKVKATDESSSFSGRMLSSIVKTFRPEPAKED